MQLGEGYRKGLYGTATQKARALEPYPARSRRSLVLTISIGSTSSAQICPSPCSCSNIVSAAERLKELTQDELAGMLVENADEPFAAEIAAEVIRTILPALFCGRAQDLIGDAAVYALLLPLPERFLDHPVLAGVKRQDRHSAAWLRMGYIEETNELQLDFRKIASMSGQEVIPVAVQNADTNEVILVAYTNEQAMRRRAPSSLIWISFMLSISSRL